jgi:hypothetical protein
MLVVMVLALATPLMALSEDQPFTKLEGKTESRWSGWGVNNRDKATHFNSERKRLGENFQRELLKYVGEDVQRHYWCAAFLSDAGYADDNPTLPKLALLLLEQGITLCNTDLSHRRNKVHLVSLSVNAALLSQQLGLAVQAKHHRARAERLVEKDRNLDEAWPVMAEDERKVFESIPYEAEKETQQVESTVPSKAAPSAPSDVR